MRCRISETTLDCACVRPRFPAWRVALIYGMSAVLLMILVAPSRPVGAAAPRLPPVALTSREYILIDGDAGFTAANGVVGGSGTSPDPYVIAGWDVSKPSCRSYLEPMGIEVRNTRAFFVIRQTYLHWDSGCAYDMTLLNVSNGRVENVTFGGLNLGVFSSRNTEAWDNSFPRGGGIDVRSSSNVTLGRNVLQSAAGAWSGSFSHVTIFNSTQVALVDNIVHSRGPCEICLEATSFARLSGNRLDVDGIGVSGSRPEHFASHTIDPDNLVNGAPVLYIRDRQGFRLLGGAYGQVILANVSSAVLLGLQYGNTSLSLQVAYADGVLVFGNRMDNRGIPSGYSYATVMTFSHSRNLQVIANVLQSTDIPLWFEQSENITIRGNNLTALDITALVIESSRNVTVTLNRFVDAWRTVWIQGSQNVTLYRNNFFRYGTIPIVFGSTRLAFDHGYPDGGNYWDDFHGMDNCRGPTQLDCEESDGIGDVWYVINATLEDRYPLMHPATAETGPATGGTPEGQPVGLVLLVGLPLATAFVVIVRFMALRHQRLEVARHRRKQEGPRSP